MLTLEIRALFVRTRAALAPSVPSSVPVYPRGMSRHAIVACIALAACDRPVETPPQRLPDVTAPAIVPAVSARIFAGGRRSCVLRDGGVRCWGDANRGSLGPGVVMSSTTVPTAIPGLEGATSVALGESHGCAVMPDASVRCWGSDEYGALGNGGTTGESPAPVPVPGLTGVTQLAAYGSQTCALAGGRISCWGDRHGKSPLDLGLADIRQIALGNHHGCARGEREVLCWGANDHGQLGVAGGDRSSAAPVPGLTSPDEIAAAGDYTCARTGGAVSCWGAGDDAQLGDPARRDDPTPHAIPSLTDAAALALGPTHACALRSSNTVACWGGSDRSPFGYPRDCVENYTGQNLSPGTSGVMQVYCAAAMPVPGLTHVAALVHGLGHACALTRTGAIRCWGGSGYGELGNRDHGAHASAAPIDVLFPEPRDRTKSTRAVAVAAQGEWSCAVLDDHSVRCWGSSALGQLGPIIKNLSATPIAIPGLTDIADLALGAYHGCARTLTGGARCWGYNGNANLGDGTTDNRRDPITPINLPEIAALSASGDSTGAHTCALAKDGSVWCWGDNRYGQSLPGGPQHISPTRVPKLTGITQVVAGLGATCVLEKGVPLCWGILPTPLGRSVVAAPATIEGVDRLVEIGMGYQVACGRRDDDTIWCWGQRQDAGLAPTQVDVGGGARALAVGSYGAAALRIDGALISWGIESTTAPRSETQLPGLTRITTSGSHTCALDDQGRVHCLGWNMNGQLGNPDQGAGGESKVPTTVPL